MSVLQPVTSRTDAGISSAEHIAHQFLRYVEELVTTASAAGSTPVTPSSVIEHFTSTLHSRQSEVSAKVITTMLKFVLPLFLFVALVNHL